ncbi:PAS domain-containing protein [Skermanella aerolata]|nr:PAS domain-containing protein [Skermanella aerolata]KJB92119.1 histidine kinase [Skermanella aerolata KACC 11604]
MLSMSSEENSRLAGVWTGLSDRDVNVQAPPCSPLVQEATAYWNLKRGSRRMPSRKDIDPVEIPRLLSSTALVDVLRDPLDFRFRLLGTAIDNITTKNLRGVRFSELPYLVEGNKGWADYAYVANTGKPLTTDRPYVGKSKMVVRLTDSLFPLSDDGETVNMVWSFLDIWWVPLRERSWNGVV